MILFSSGIPGNTLASLKRRWRVLNIASQREALAYLQSLHAQGQPLPLAVAVGYAHPTAAAEDLSAQQMLREIHKLDATLPVIISTGTRDVPTIVDLIKRGAFDYVLETRKGKDGQPADPGDPPQRYTQELLLAFGRATKLRKLQLENAQLRAGQHDDGSEDHAQRIEARSPQMRQILELTRKVAPTPATVLVTGESGTGKELIARAIHQQSGRADHPFVAVNCGALSEQLLTSELFGHVKGAFTGADVTRQGLLQEAGQGTLFLDEIGTVPLSFQVMLLRVLEEGSARPVGSTASYPVACRFIAAANHDLEAMIQKGTFREDLWYRLNIFNIHLPPLRKRAGDIPVLAHHFLRQLAQRYGKAVDTIAPAAMTMLEEYHWPGNVRQMRNVIERALIVAEGSSLQREDFASNLLAAPGESHAGGGVSGSTSGGGASGGVSYGKAMARFETHLLSQALAQHKGNLSKAARSLRLNRTTLLYRLKKLGIEVDR